MSLTSKSAGKPTKAGAPVRSHSCQIHLQLARGQQAGHGTGHLTPNPKGPVWVTEKLDLNIGRRVATHPRFVPNQNVNSFEYFFLVGASIPLDPLPAPR